MPGWREPYIQIIADQMGYIEKASDKDLEDKLANPGDKNYTKYGEFMGLQGQPWCHSMLSWGGPQIGMPYGIIPHTGSCASGIKFFMDKGRWHPRDKAKPQRGWFTYFEKIQPNGKADRHVGLIYNVDATHIYTYEGNTSSVPGMVSNGGMARPKAYPLTYALIKGYGEPEWGDEEVSILSKLYERAQKELDMSQDQVDDRLLKILQQTNAQAVLDQYEADGVTALTTMGLLSAKHDPLEIANIGLVGEMLRRFKEKFIK